MPPGHDAAATRAASTKTPHLAVVRRVIPYL